MQTWRGLSRRWRTAACVTPSEFPITRSARLSVRRAQTRFSPLNSLAGSSPSRHAQGGRWREVATASPVTKLGYERNDSTTSGQSSSINLAVRLMTRSKCHGLVYFIRQGRGRLDYKLQTECFSKDRLSRLYIYDPADLARVAAGRIEPFEVRGKVTDWAEPGIARGATWDGERLYVFHEGTWKQGVERYPSIHVFEVVE